MIAFLQRSKLGSLLCLTICCGGALGLIWSQDYVPTQDGASHLENAGIINNHNHQNFPLTKTFYNYDTNWGPSSLGHELLSTLMTFFSPATAEKVLLSLYAILFLTAALLLLNHVNPKAQPLLVGFLPLLFSNPFHMGSYNFCFSLTLYLFTLYLVIRNSSLPNFDNTVLFLALVSMTSLFHIFVGGLLSLSLVCLFRSPNMRLKSNRLFASAYLFAVLTPLALALTFARSNSDTPIRWIPYPERFYTFIMGRGLWSFSSEEIYLALAFSMVLIFFAIACAIKQLGKEKLTKEDFPALIPIAMACLYFILPEQFSGGAYVGSRINLVFLISLFLWVATRDHKPLIQKLLLTLSILFAIGFLYLYSTAYKEINGELDKLAQIQPHLENNSTLLPIIFYPHGRSVNGVQLSNPVQAIRHSSALLSVNRDIVRLTNYEANLNYFPISYKSELNPFSLLYKNKRLDQVREHPDLEAYSTVVGKVPDYILTWHEDIWFASNPGHERFKTILKDYVVVKEIDDIRLYRSPDHSS